MLQIQTMIEQCASNLRERERAVEMLIQKIPMQCLGYMQHDFTRFWIATRRWVVIQSVAESVKCFKTGFLTSSSNRRGERAARRCIPNSSGLKSSNTR